MRELTISLDDPGTTALHRVGLAGLWMTLKAFDEERSLGELVRAEGAWELGSRSVRLSWTGDATRFFRALVTCSFRVDGNGLAHFPGLGPPAAHPASAVVLQEALLGTFLQHGKTRKADPPRSGSLGVSEGDAQNTTPVTFRRLTHYIHMDARIDLGKNTTLAGWNFPGGAVRHTSFVNDTALEEPAGRYLALLYAPAAAYYFVLAPRNRGKQGRYCLVLPELDDLAKYAKGRTQFERAPARSFERRVVPRPRFG